MMSDRRTKILIFVLGDPHRLEGAVGSNDRATNPCTIFPLWRCDTVDRHCGWRYGFDLILQTIGNAGTHSATTINESVGIQDLMYVNFTLHIKWSYESFHGFLHTPFPERQKAGIEPQGIENNVITWSSAILNFFPRFELEAISCLKSSAR